MNVRLKYFGMIAEATNTREESLNIEEGQNVKSLVNMLEARYRPLKNASYKIAVNMNLADDNLIINDSDEIALLPPFAGG